jgi:hypothetical protein
LPFFAWALHREQRTLQSMLMILLDEAGSEWKLTRVHPSSTAPTAKNPAESRTENSPFSAAAKYGSGSA